MMKLIRKNKIRMRMKKRNVIRLLQKAVMKVEF